MRSLFQRVAVIWVIGLGNGLVQAGPEVNLQPIYEGLTFERPVALCVPEDGSDRRFLVEQTGLIKILPQDEAATADPEVFMDLSEHMVVDRAFEEGLLGMAFHPKYAENGRFYLYYTKQGPKRSVISEFQVSKGDANRGDLSSERILMEIQQPDWNHNSGNLMFHPTDGYLYIAVGDGGRRNGVFLLAQNKGRWNGKILRIDVDSRSAGREYGIPDDNPFIDDKVACPEIWALGLRNPWGWDVDEKTGLFYMADVGQDLWEEINLIERGGNYGWEHREGAQGFAPRARLMEALGQQNKTPEGVSFIDPIHQYDHSPDGGLSITGGYVYQGDKIPDLAGFFLYGDWRFGNMWAVRHDPLTKETTNHVLHKPADISEPVAQPTAFYPDENGEPIVLCWKGKIFRMVGK